MPRNPINGKSTLVQVMAWCHHGKTTCADVNPVLMFMLSYGITRQQWVNSSLSNHPHPHPPSAPYMCWWTASALVQVMACHLFGTKPIPEPMLTLRNKLQWNLNKNTKLFIHNNAFEISSVKWRPLVQGEISKTKVNHNSFKHQSHRSVVIILGSAGVVSKTNSDKKQETNGMLNSLCVN